MLLAAVGTVLFLVLGGEDEAKAQTVRFQQPVDVGPDPFIDKPADRKGRKKVKITPSSTEVGAGPFGGTGSDLVCDRDLLIESLKARPDRLAEWARVLGVEPTIKAVGEYIVKLHPVTLTRDTRVTNHSFVNGRAVGFQSILAAGTAVLVDDYGNPVVRCRCGNPLLKPIFIPEAVCLACPPRYQPPPACPYTEETTYRRRWYPDRYYSNASYDEIFIRRFTSDCYAAYPDPPRVTITDIYNPKFRPRRPARTPRPQVTAPPSATTPPSSGGGDAYVRWSPTSGGCRTYELYASGFDPGADLAASITSPSGQGGNYDIVEDGLGAGSYSFDTGAGCEQGTWTATVVDPASGEEASATLTIGGGGSGGGEVGGGGDPGAADEGGLQCNPPRTQLEAEQCAAAGH